MERADRRLGARRTVDARAGAGPGGPYPLLFISRAGGKIEEGPRKFASRVEQLGYSSPYVIGSTRAITLVGGLPLVGSSVPPVVPSELELHRAALAVRNSSADVVVGIGGGRTLDVAKVIAGLARVPMIAFPTQLSHDGLASPVSVLVEANGAKRSVSVDPPTAVFLSLPVLANAPTEAYKAGVGDLISNAVALRDWELAETRGRDSVNREAWSLSEESLELIQPLLQRSPDVAAKDPESLALLGTALVNSGRAMFIAGSSRPASGAEHKISHSIDSLLGSRGLHGAQVAFASLISAELHEEPVKQLMSRLEHLGLPAHPRQLALTREELIAVVLHASRSRPERYTVLDECGLDRTRVSLLLDKVWGI